MLRTGLTKAGCSKLSTQISTMSKERRFQRRRPQKEKTSKGETLKGRRSQREKTPKGEDLRGRKLRREKTSKREALRGRSPGKDQPQPSTPPALAVPLFLFPLPAPPSHPPTAQLSLLHCTAARTSLSGAHTAGCALTSHHCCELQREQRPPRPLRSIWRSSHQH